MTINIIVAMDRKRAIGKNNALPWYLPADLQHFKKLTLGRTIIVGRKTHESIIARLNHPLPGRKTIVVTRQEFKPQPDLQYARSLADAMALTRGEEAFIIGGAQIYQQALELSDRIYLTQVEADIEGGDTFFPEIDKAIWQQTHVEKHPADSKNEYPYAFITLEKI